MSVSVLVVDDDVEFRSLMAGMLRAAGHDRVQEAGTVADALTTAARMRPEVALVDVGLPDGDGFALVGELVRLSDPPRVVLISADGDAADDRAARSVGAVGFVAKDELTDTRLRELVDRP